MYKNICPSNKEINDNYVLHLDIRISYSRSPNSLVVSSVDNYLTGYYSSIPLIKGNVNLGASRRSFVRIAMCAVR